MGITIHTINSAIGGMQENGLSEKTIKKQAVFLARGIREGSPNVRDAVNSFVDRSIRFGSPHIYLRTMKILRVLSEGETSSPEVQSAYESAFNALLLRVNSTNQA